MYGAKIEQVTSSTAAQIRKRTLKNREEETKRPPRKYDIGNTIYVRVKGIPFTNAIIIGFEWGADHRSISRNVWAYWIRGSHTAQGAEAYLITEDRIVDRISL